MLVMTLLVRDEEEILEANLDYHFAQGVDFAIVTDHGSTDATPEILDDYVSRGLVRVLEAGGDQHHQSRRVTRMAEEFGWRARFGCAESAAAMSAWLTQHKEWI